jgi:protein-disulfide isomerase
VFEKNPDTVTVVYKNFPLRSHKYATTSAVAALAAGRQGKFWEFHDELFKIYKQIDEKKIIEIAQQIGLDMNQFNNDINDPAIRKLIRDDYQEGLSIGVRGVPAVFINGKKFQGRKIEDYQAAIDEIINKAKTQ